MEDSSEQRRPDGAAAEMSRSSAVVLESVPCLADHCEPPCKSSQIAWQYLHPEKRMRRWTETIKILDLRRSRREITIDFSLPDCDVDDHWLVPTAYLSKWPVAPDLEVTDASSTAISVPTMQENMAITMAALDQLADAKLISFDSGPHLRDLVHQVVFDPSLEARVARFLAERELGPDDALLRSLLRALEDQFLLWVPASGTPGCDRQIRICRRLELERDPVLPRSRVAETRNVETALGPISVTLQAETGRRRPSPAAVAKRLLRIFGLVPFEFEQETAEPQRFASFHLCLQAPDGMIIRDLGADPSQTQNSHEYSCRGRETGLAHYHFSRAENPPEVRTSTTLGVRGGLTGLWAGAVAFTTLLLWAVDRLASPDLPSADNGQLEATVAILLVGPVLASAWAIRADRGELLESTVVGARGLLLISAVLSVGVCLSLAELRPFRWNNETAIEIYASASYALAVLVVIGWAVTLSFTWLVYREFLISARRNYAAILVTALLAASITVHEGVPARLVGFVLLGAGLVLATIAAHPGRPIAVERAGPPSAWVGTVVALFGAGWFLGFYQDMVSRHAVSLAVVAGSVALALFAAIQCWRKGWTPPIYSGKVI